MRQLARLLRYVRPYAPHVLASVVLMSAVGLLDAFRVLLVGPIFNAVLNPGAGHESLPLFPGSHSIDLRQLIPSYFHNAWTVVAVALVGSTILKGVFDYLGLQRSLHLTVDQFVGLALSSSHAAGLVERFSEAGARTALCDLAAPHRTASTTGTCPSAICFSASPRAARLIDGV